MGVELRNDVPQEGSLDFAQPRLGNLQHQQPGSLRDVLDPIVLQRSGAGAQPAPVIGEPFQLAGSQV